MVPLASAWSFSLPTARTRAVLLALVLGGCSEVRVSEVARRADPVWGGATAAGESQVFLLDLRFNNGTNGICSAVLISPRVLLTAAHCADPAYEGASSVTIAATNEPNDSMLMMSDMIPVTTRTLHPSWNPSNPDSDFDLALLLLSRAPVGVSPAPRPAGTASLSGQAIKVVGYGRSSSDPATSGTRRSVMLTVNSVQSATFHFGTSSAGTCVGDSGGPSFLGAEVVGIHSRGNGTCGTDDIDIRVDVYRPFIDGFIAANDPAACTADGRCATGCPSPDPDCPCAADGTCNATCSSTPDPDCGCTADGTCGASCGTADPDCCGADGTCDLACGANGASDPDCRCRADSMCGAGCGSRDPDCCRADGRCDASCAPADVDCTNCGADGTCNAACGLSDSDCLDDGQVCTDAALCWGGLCADDPRGFKFCSRACTDDAACVNDTTCQAGVCRANRDPPGPVTGGCASAPVSACLLLLLACVRRTRT